MLNHDKDADDVVGFGVETLVSRLLGPDDVVPEPVDLGHDACRLRGARLHGLARGAKDRCARSLGGVTKRAAGKPPLEEMPGP
jgi:hypothetical protein